jgi:hypothetical protein
MAVEQCLSSEVNHLIMRSHNHLHWIRVLVIINCSANRQRIMMCSLIWAFRIRFQMRMPLLASISHNLNSRKNWLKQRISSRLSLRNLWQWEKKGISWNKKTKSSKRKSWCYNPNSDRWFPVFPTLPQLFQCKTRCKTLFQSTISAIAKMCSLICYVQSWISKV